MRDELSEEEIRETWWSSTEYHGIRLGAKFLTKEIRKHDRESIVGIEEAYARALHLACTLSDADYEEMMADCRGQAICMQAWCDRKISPRGLERYTSAKHRVDRAEFADETRAAVIRLARTGTVSADQLSVFYKEYARSAAIFARFCGEADYLVTKSFDLEEMGEEPTSSKAEKSSSASRSSRIPPRQVSFDSRSSEPSQGRILVRELSQRVER